MAEAMKSLHDIVNNTVVENSLKFTQPIVKDKTSDAVEKAVKFIKGQ